MSFRTIVFITGLLAFASHAPAQTTVSLAPIRDNTLYEASSPASNGAGSGMFCGMNGNARRRRALLDFDVAAALPAGATILGATLTLELTQTNAGPLDVSLHRVSADWGEGTSVSAFNGGGLGAFPSSGDCTWNHRFFSTVTWATPGGDFDPAPSATSTVGATFESYTWSTAQLALDVQSALDAPASFHGWLLRSPESEVGNAKRFASREEPVVAMRPRLDITYTLYPGTGDDFILLTGLDAAPNAMPLKTAMPTQFLTLDVASPLGTFTGDFFLVAAQLTVTGIVPSASPISTAIYLDPFAFPPPLVFVDLTPLSTTGFAAPLGVIPAGLAGLSVFLQSVLVSTAASNGLYAATDAHELRF